MSYYNQRYAQRVSNPIKKDAGLLQRLEKILTESLDARSKGFVESLRDFCKQSGGLTERQLSSFQKIESRFSAGEKSKLIAWGMDYKANHLPTAKILAAYYSTTGYWTELATSILNDPNFIPPKWKYEKMSGNKYAQRIIDEGTRDAKFSVNDMIQFRSTAGKTANCSRDLRSLRHRLCIVIDNALPIRSPVAGGKRYKVLPLGFGHAIEVEERDIMKPNKKGVTS